jgi:hypothetical protein
MVGRSVFIKFIATIYNYVIMKNHCYIRITVTGQHMRKVIGSDSERLVSVGYSLMSACVTSNNRKV